MGEEPEAVTEDPTDKAGAETDDEAVVVASESDRGFEGVAKLAEKLDEAEDDVERWGTREVDMKKAQGLRQTKACAST